MTEVADRLVGFELTLRGKELARLGLTSPMAWDEGEAIKAYVRQPRHLRKPVVYRTEFLD
ncbi:UNVERIFIED_ORG: hypothetical protein HNP28_001821 [Comamonas terrigena]